MAHGPLVFFTVILCIFHSIDIFTFNALLTNECALINNFRWASIGSPWSKALVLREKYVTRGLELHKLLFACGGHAVFSPFPTL